MPDPTPKMKFMMVHRSGHQVVEWDQEQIRQALIAEIMRRVKERDDGVKDMIREGTHGAMNASEEEFRHRLTRRSKVLLRDAILQADVDRIVNAAHNLLLTHIEVAIGAGFDAVVKTFKRLTVEDWTAKTDLPRIEVVESFGDSTDEP